ncbi:MAG: DUF2922 domain-containing protein [Defluviitaleaceae bacterium]|nr:DUF2922 domain-containing protein [Defluviitaleaceae bacterium]
MKESCQMTFSTSLGGTRTVSVPDPHAGLNAAAVNEAAGMFIMANPFNAETGALVELLRASRVTVSRQVIIATPAA